MLKIADRGAAVLFKAKHAVPMLILLGKVVVILCGKK